MTTECKKNLLSFKLLADAEDWQFVQKESYIFCSLLFKKRSRASIVPPKRSFAPLKGFSPPWYAFWLRRCQQSCELDRFLFELVRVQSILASPISSLN